MAMETSYYHILEDYIGHLEIASMASFQRLTELVEHTDNRKVQKEREQKLAQILKDRLYRYVQGDKEGFIQEAKSKVQLLVGAGNGSNILQTIGYIYEREAAKELPKKGALYLGLSYIVEWFRNIGHFQKSLVTAGTGAFALLQLLEDIQEQRSTEENYGEADLEAFLQPNREWIVHSLWKVNVPDIEHTLSHVSQIVLQDESAKKEDLEARAKGLKILGKIFQTAKL